MCQSLYEGKGKGGYITYPRTDSVYLEESLTDKASQTLNRLKHGLPYEDKTNLQKLREFSIHQKSIATVRLYLHISYLTHWLLMNK